MVMIFSGEGSEENGKEEPLSIIELPSVLEVFWAQESSSLKFRLLFLLFTSILNFDFYFYYLLVPGLQMGVILVRFI